MSDIRQKIYLAALLEDIPENTIQKTFDSIEGVAVYLKYANIYATANNPQRGNQTFVVSPFEKLKNKEEVGNYYFDFQTLNLTDSFFSKKEQDLRHSKSIGNLWADFATDFHHYAKQKNVRKRAETVLNLLHKYAVTIPNPTTVHPDVSWYDYAKIKAGLAVCIYDYLKKEKKDLSFSIQDDDKPILIIRADVSGIQNFIGDIASKNASKNLKGRSFYVQLLSDTVLKLMLEWFKLFQGNIMYASGGNFFVIAPNTSKIKKLFRELEREITEDIFKEHQTRISIVMGYEEVSQSQILSGEINEAIVNLFENKIDIKKKRKFATLIKEDYNDFFEPSEKGGDIATDVITGEEIATDNDKNIIYKMIETQSLPELATPRQIEEGTDLIKETTAKQIFLGHHLKDVDYLVTTKSSLNLTIKRADEYFIEPCGLGIRTYTVVDKPEITSVFDKALSESGEFSISTINGFKEGNNFMLYGGNKVPVVKEKYDSKDGEKRYPNSPLYFNEMSGNGDFKRLAVLRMDIDGLGSIFKTDIIRDNLIFSNYAALSRNLDWFFKGYLNTIWENNEDFKNNTQIIYSGGDDLFIIGRWDLIIDFAEQIKDEFSKFTKSSSTNEKDKITISGGIAIVTDKFPIMKASAFAGEAEHAAKSHKLVGGKDTEFEKNSLNLLGVSLHWDSEYLFVKELKDELVKYIDDKYGIPKSLLSKIKIHANNARLYRIEKIKFNRTKGNTINQQAPSPTWVWTALYDFSRFTDRVKGENKIFMSKLQNKLDETNKELLRTFFIEKVEWSEMVSNAILTNKWKCGNPINTQYYFLELLGFAARWAELEIRTKPNN